MHNFLAKEWSSDAFYSFATRVLKYNMHVARNSLHILCALCNSIVACGQAMFSTFTLFLFEIISIISFQNGILHATLQIIRYTLKNKTTVPTLQPPAKIPKCNQKPLPPTPSLFPPPKAVGVSLGDNSVVLLDC